MIKYRLRERYFYSVYANGDMRSDCLDDRNSGKSMDINDYRRCYQALFSHPGALYRGRKPGD